MGEFTSETNQVAQEETSSVGASPEDDRDPALQKDPSDWVSGSGPMTPSQQSYLDTLAGRPARNCLPISARPRHRSTSIG
jgi:hypothetical protein